MADDKYVYNPETLKYTKLKRTRKEKFRLFFTYFFALAFAGVILNVVYNVVADSPKEKRLKREKDQLLFQYHILNDKLGQIDKVLKDLRHRDDNIYRTIFEAEPLHSTYREAGFGGVNQYEELERLDNADIIIAAAKKLDQLNRKAYIQSLSYDEVIDLAQRKEEQLASIPAIQPISNKDLTRTASGWGYRIHPIYKIRKFHEGMDFTAPLGTEIYSTGDGVIEELRKSNRGYGNKIVVNHGFGYRTLYAHLNTFNVRKGQKVKRGDVIGYVGTTGTSTAPHLHYEVSINRKKVNPINYYFNDLSPEQYEEMIEISLHSGQTFD
ncbi:M23 family metallopeptidase [Bacteroidales bacterium]|nr:M23 family metallopeptidase [Bacteroidales bacterium]